ncbi:MAG: secondary thiamine-phosphate synthase enzyme YjbQ [Gemmataceae bacterium]
METITVQSQHRKQMIDITSAVRSSLQQSPLKEGIGVIYCPHTTAGITINENCDPDVVHDMLLCLERMIPMRQQGFRHGEGNSDSHIQTAMIGPSVAVIVTEGKIVLGTWQGIFLCEFDGPRTRKVHIQWVGK